MNHGLLLQVTLPRVITPNEKQEPERYKFDCGLPTMTTFRTPIQVLDIYCWLSNVCFWMLKFNITFTEKRGPWFLFVMVGWWKYWHWRDQNNFRAFFSIWPAPPFSISISVKSNQYSASRIKRQVRPSNLKLYCYSLKEKRFQIFSF